MSHNDTTPRNTNARWSLVSGVLHSTHQVRPRLRRLALLGSLLSVGCSDSPSGVAEAPRRVEGVPAAAIGGDSLSPALAMVIRGLERESSTRGVDSRARAVMRFDGVEREVVGPLAIRDALVSSMQRSHLGDDVTSGKFSTFNVPMDGEKSLYITGVGSFVLASPTKFQFTSVTYINKNTNAQFTFNSDRTVYAISGGASIPIWSASGTQVRSDINGNSAVAWPDFNLSGGCQFSASNSTGHSVAWPWGFVVPGVIVEHASDRSGGSNAVSRSCAPSTPPPSEPLCEENVAGCPTGGSGGSGRTTGGAVVREIGRSGGYKTVCYVTDWYENGVYVETTIDRCWTEPIY